MNYETREMTRKEEADREQEKLSNAPRPSGKPGGAKGGMEIVFREESYRIMGACFEVYKEKGNGFLEAVYQECLGMEFAEQQIPFLEQPQLKLRYKTRTLKQTYTPDFLCFDHIILEIKAVKNLADEYRAQVINYLKSTDMELGLLLNFGHYPKLEHERFVNQTSRAEREELSCFSFRS